MILFLLFFRRGAKHHIVTVLMRKGACRTFNTGGQHTSVYIYWGTVRQPQTISSDAKLWLSSLAVIRCEAKASRALRTALPRRYFYVVGSK